MGLVVRCACEGSSFVENMVAISVRDYKTGSGEIHLIVNEIGTGEI